MSDSLPANDSLALFIALHQNDWQGFFDAGALQRGKRYAKQRRVLGSLSLQREDERVMLTGEVEGSRKRPYLTEVEIGVLGHDEELFTDCSCPVGMGCKHAVALIQAFLDQLAKTPEAFAERQPPHPDPTPGGGEEERLKQHWANWIGQLERPAGPVRDGHRVGAEYRLGLFLDSGGRFGNESVLAVLPVWLRPSKQRTRGNGWVSPRGIEVGPSGELLPAPAEGWVAEQEEAIDQLMHGEVEMTWSSTQRMWALVSHPFQARALWSLLESDEPPLLFYRKQTGIQLTQGPACRLVPRWQADDQGIQRLQPSTDPQGILSSEAVIARAGRQLCYLDPERGRFGRMDGSPELLTRLRRAPPLPPEISDWLGERFRRSPTLADQLPTPSRVEEQTLEDVVPRLKVTMTVAEGQIGFRHGAPLPRWIQAGAAVVGFDYDGIEVPPEEGETAKGYREGQRLTIQRDPKAEVDLVRSLPPGMVTLEQLSEIDAVPAIWRCRPGRCCCPSMARRRPAPWSGRPTWRVPMAGGR